MVMGNTRHHAKWINIMGVAMLRLRWLVIILMGALLGLSVAAQTPVDVLRDDPELSQFVAWLDATHTSLTSDQPYTLFAPTNDAIMSLPTSAREALDKDMSLLTRVVQYHLVKESWPAIKLTSNSLISEEGSVLTVLRTRTRLTVDGVLVVSPGKASEGLVIHKLQGVLLPPITLPLLDLLDISGDIVTAGSSTVSPLTQSMATLFSQEGYSDNIQVDSIGTGAGFERFCIAVETDIVNASRPIKPEEEEACRASGLEPLEFRVGTDTLTIVVSSANTFVTDLSLAELAFVFSDAKTWQDVRPEWPAEPIRRYSPGTDSGTYDYFIESVFNNEPAAFLAAEPIMSEDDEALARGVEESPFAITYFGYAYYLEHKSQLKLVSVNGVIPSQVSVQNGLYPLARTLYIYTAASIFKEKPEVAAFIQFYIDNVNDYIVNIGYFPVPERGLNLSRLIWLATKNS
jgi:phosphate transport system substrate-binding protein